MLRTYGPGPSLWESVLPKEALVMPDELAWVCWFELAPPRCFEVAPPTSALYLFATSLAFFNGMGRSFWGVWSFSVGPRQPPPMSSFMEMGSLQHGQ
jgi:hypothetical protein